MKLAKDLNLHPAAKGCSSTNSTVYVQLERAWHVVPSSYAMYTKLECQERSNRNVHARHTPVSVRVYSYSVLYVHR